MTKQRTVEELDELCGVAFSQLESCSWCSDEINKARAEIRRRLEAMEGLTARILDVGTVYPDHTDAKPSVCYGSPESKEWAGIFSAAVRAARKGE